MKIAIISPKSLPVPPKDYGGTQRVIHHLAEELVARGHKVILFAPKGSKTKAKLFEYPSKNKKKILSFIAKSMPEDVDIIHDHYGNIAKVNPPIPTLRQSHGNNFIKRAQIPVYVSETMLRTIGKNKGYFLRNGIKLSEYEYREQKEDYLLFLGRLTPDKGVHHAIEAAHMTGRRLIIAGPVHHKEGTEYFNTQIKPHLNSSITYIGSVGGNKKRRLLANAYCVLFPSIWNEPFGLIPIEALASGTPVLGFRHGAIPEVLQGFPDLICSDTQDMADKLKTGVVFPSPAECREYVTRYFSEKTMVDETLKLYEHIIRKKKYKLTSGSEWSKLRKKRR